MDTIVAIHVSTSLDAALRTGRRKVGQSLGSSRAFRKLLTTYGLKPEPLISGRQVTSLECIWHAACPAQQAAEIVQKLLSTPGVEGAYAKPPEGLPDPL